MGKNTKPEGRGTKGEKCLSRFLFQVFNWEEEGQSKNGDSSWKMGEKGRRKRPQNKK